jgi:hypothetical protein
MQISEAQADLRRAYLDAGPGTIISGLVWAAAAVAEARSGIRTGFITLFFGGMLIFPLSLLVNRVLLRRAPESPDNPLGKVVLESTIAMLAAFLPAWLFLQHAPALVMPLAALAVGAHYFAFRTAYGMTAFWALGGLLMAMSVAAIYRVWPAPELFVPAVAVLEILFGAVLMLRALRR